jgi:hypothetical protein
MTCSGPPCVRGLPGVRPASARHPPPSSSSRRRRWAGPALDRPGCAGLALGLGHECDSLGPSLRRALDFCVYKYTSWLKFYSVQSINKKTASASQQRVCTQACMHVCAICCVHDSPSVDTNSQNQY